MLRVTTTDEAQTITLKLEGKLVGPWVREVRHVWARTATDSERRYVVDLSSVTFIDNPGRVLLAAMCKRGARFIATDCLTRTIVDEIQREGSA